MKILYIASNPESHPDLMLPEEITELTEVARKAQGEPIELIFQPALPIHLLPRKLLEIRPDILHISAHATTSTIELANANGKAVRLTADALLSFLAYPNPPKLVYINACDSKEMAAELTRKAVQFAIGTTAPITNRAARNAAVGFYEQLFEGMAISDAYAAAKVLIETLQDKSCSAVLHVRAGSDASRTSLHNVPRIIARFENDTCKSSHGYYSIDVGVVGCLANTSQLIIFTDDITVLETNTTDEYKLGGQLCRVIRDTPVNGVIWSTETEEIFGNYKLFACGVTGKGTMFTARAELAEALELYYGIGQSSHLTEISNDLKKDVADALTALRAEDGARKPFTEPRNSRSSNPKSKTESRPRK